MARLGEIIDGKYEVLREIGKGGMSVVYLAMDKRLNKQWAIKEFRKDKDDASKQVALKALLDEANLMKKLDHPTLPRIVDIIETNQTVYIVMDYIEGESLNKVLDAYGAQPQEAVIEWAKQLSGVLDYLHTQNPPVIYRDMKPANIMLKPDGTVRLIDFGIAREYKEGKEGDTEAIGTRGYAAPEQFGGRGQTDARTDIYSLGVTLYHLVTGKNPAEPPYEIYPIRHWDPALSSGLEWLIQKCTQLNPNDRYQSCAEVTYVLENLDKFEGAYQKKLRSKVNTFIVSSVLTVVFGVACAGFLIGANQVKKSSYESYLKLGTIEGYEQAIATDSERPDAYKELALYLRGNVTKIYARNKDHNGNERSLSNTECVLDHDDDKEGSIKNWFSTDDFEKLKEENPVEYATVNYELGRLLWNYYEGDSGQAIEAITISKEYFGKVITVFKDAEEAKDADFSLSKYNLAKAYYLVSFFQTHKQELNMQDDGEFTVNENAAIDAGVYGIDKKSKTIENPYYSFWSTNKELLTLISGDNDMSDTVRLESLKRLAYIMRENYAEFYKKTKDKEEKVDSEEMIEVYKMFSEALQKVEDSDDTVESKESIRKSLNGLIPELNSFYEIELEEV